MLKALADTRVRDIHQRTPALATTDEPLSQVVARTTKAASWGWSPSTTSWPA